MSELAEKSKLKWIYGIGGLFILINSLLISNEFFLFPLIPVVIGVALLSLVSLDILVLIIVFCTPFSVNISDIGAGVGLSLPTDPLLFGVMILFFIKLLIEHRFDSDFTKHPVTVCVLIYMAWIAITSITSELPLVSIKFFISKTWFIVSFYFVASQIFRKENRIGWYAWLYIISFIGIIFYTIIHHGIYGFKEQPAHWVMSPFYNDHTSYGALLAFFYPFIIGNLMSLKVSRSLRLVLFGVFALFTIALVLSYTRAAWVSLVGALGVYIIMRLRIKFITVLGIGITLLVLFFSVQEQIIMKLEKNRQDSSADFTKHLQSISNISSDASNLERINRWKSAFRMFAARPFLGWGPGTYMFKYAPFQNSNERTIISTNAGDAGNAHSEYIGPLAESGFLGTLTFLFIIFYVSYTAITLYSRMPDGTIKLYLVTLFLGLITYFIHGFLNNFLDTDKAAAPFWGFIAAIVVIDINFRKKENLIES